MTVLVLVEGPTEEAFVKNCLSPYLVQHDIYMQPIVVTTKRVLSGLKTTGGLSNGNLKKFLDDLNRMINSTPAGGLVTTLVDFYALPSNFPGTSTLAPAMSILEKINHLETSLVAHFDTPHHFIPYIQMHEFEAYLFSSSSGFVEYIDPALGNVAALTAIVAQYDNPELINGNKATSPSHRILDLYPAYNKPFEGNMMLMEIGIDVIIDRCPRFKAWIESIIARK